MNILEVQNLCKTYGKGEAAVQALRNVTFSVHKGEFVAIVGESGSGKSTLLNVVGALDNPTAGEVIALLQSMSQKYQQTILMITHNENQAGAADRVFRMSDGVLKDLGVALR